MSANGLRDLVNRKMEEDGLSLTQATNNILKQLKGDGDRQLAEVRKIQDMRLEMDLDPADPVSRAIDQELQIAQLERIRGNGGNGHGGGMSMEQIMAYTVLLDALDNRAFKQQMRTLEIERAKKLMDGGLPPEVEDYINGIRVEHNNEVEALKARLPSAEPPMALPPPTPQGVTLEEITESFSDAITEVATPIAETMREMQTQIDTIKAGGGKGAIGDDLLTQLDRELTAYKAQQTRIENLAASMGWKKAETSEALGRLASRHEVLADIRDGVDIIKYAGDELGIWDKFHQLFGSPPAEKSLAEFDHWQQTRDKEPVTEAEKLIKRENLTRRDVEVLRLTTYDAIKRSFDAGEYTEEQTKRLLEWKAIICEDQAMLHTIRGTTKLPVPSEDQARCGDCDVPLVNGMCPKCEVS